MVATLEGIRRTIGTAPAKKRALGTDDITRIITAIDAAARTAALAASRDRALVLIGFAGGLRRSELAGLDAQDVEDRKGGIAVTLRRSKTDQTGSGRTVGIVYGTHSPTCPVRALRSWTHRASITSGPCSDPSPATATSARPASPDARSPASSKAVPWPQDSTPTSSRATRCAQGTQPPQPRTAPTTAPSWPPPATRTGAPSTATSNKENSSTTLQADTSASESQPSPPAEDAVGGTASTTYLSLAQASCDIGRTKNRLHGTTDAGTKGNP